MDPLNPWYPQQELEDELAYMYNQQEEPPPPPQHYTSTSVPLMAPPDPFHPSHPCSSSFPSFGGSAALPNAPFGAMTAVKVEEGQPSSTFSSIFPFAGGHHHPSTLSFSGEDLPDDIEVMRPPPERRSRAHLSTQQDHVVAERRRREKMQQQFMALATVVPDLTKTDKVSLLGSTIKYVKQLEEKVKTLEQQSARRTSESTVVFASQSTDDDCSEGLSGSSGSSPAIKANIHGDTVLLKICCEERRGLLVMLVSQLENLGLSIINTNVLPFTDSYLNITITAKITEGFCTTADELIKNIATVVRGYT
ncbi:hypothetical protein ACP4OV_010793 [Aristida adscensionis]